MGATAIRDIDIAVIGAGRIGRRHCELVAANERSVLAAVVDPAPEAREFAGQLGAAWFADVGELLQGKRPSAAIVATPNALHLAHAEACLGAGIPVLVEKPIATTVADGSRLAAAADRHGVPVLVGHHRRHSPIMSAARDLIVRGEVGEVVAVSATTLFAKPASYFAAAHWRQLPGGGPMLINLIHDVDALRTLVGEVAIVHAVTSSAVRRRDVEETVSVAVCFGDGAIGSMLLSDAAASPISWELTTGEDPVYPRYPNRDCYVVAGTRGTLGIPTMRLTLAEGEPSWHEPMRTWTVAVPPADPLVRQLEHFCDVVEGGAAPVCGPADAVESLRVTLAIAESARTAQAVECSPAVQGRGARSP